jgi:anti-sigma regulatory factor (Ser/Thr protein kinase)
MEDLSLHILDLAENSIDAGAGRIWITLREDRTADTFTMTLRDNGKGMDTETLQKIADPFFSTKTVRSRKFGLGIPLLAQAAHECNGRFSVVSSPGEGTTVTVEFRLGHIDRKPLGDMGATMMVLVSGHPEIDFSLTYEADGFLYSFDTAALREELEGMPLSLPSVLQLIKKDINTSLGGH